MSVIPARPWPDAPGSAQKTLRKACDGKHRLGSILLILSDGHIVSQCLEVREHCLALRSADAASPASAAVKGRL